MTWGQPGEPPRHYGAYLHTRDQLRARYGLTLTYGEYEHVCGQLNRQGICQGHPAVIRLHHGRWIVRWRIFSTPVVLVYESDTAVIVTALPDHDSWEYPRFRKKLHNLKRGECRKRKHRSRQP